MLVVEVFTELVDLENRASSILVELVAEEPRTPALGELKVPRAKTDVEDKLVHGQMEKSLPLELS